MAGLQSRVGRKLFPNRSWIKPGYEPPKRSLLNRPSPEDEGEPELYSLGASPRAATSCDPMRSHNATPSSSASRHSSSPTRPYVPLLERIQMEPDGGGPTDMDTGDGNNNKQAKSLLDRVECPLDGATDSPAAAVPAGLAHNDTEGNTDGDSRTGTLPTLPNHPALIGQISACSTSGHPVNITCGQLKGQHNTLLSRGADSTREHSQGSSSNGIDHSQSRPLAATSSPPPPGGPSSSKGDNASTLGPGDHRSPSNQPISRESTSSSMTTEEFLNHILPLAQRIAQTRAGDSETGNSTNAAEVNSTVVTQEAIEEFNKKLLNLRNDLEHHCDELKKNEMTTDDSCDANKSRSQDTVLISTRLGSLRPMSPPIQPPQVETSPEVELSARLSNREIHIPIPILEDATKTDSSPVTPASRPRGKNSYSESRYHTRKPYSPEPRRSGDYKGRKDRYHDDMYHRSSKGKEPSRRSVSPYRRSYTSHKRTRKDSHSHRDYSPRYRRSRSRERLRDRSRSRSPRRSRERGRHHRTDRSYRDSDSGRSERLAPDSVASTSITKRRTENKNESHKEATASSAESTGPFPPCHNVPGLWFAKQGLHQLGISIVEFEIDEVTATKWNIRDKGETRTNDASSDTAATASQLSLELCCLAFCDVQVTLQKLGKDVTSHELVQVLSTLKKTWPPKGNVIVTINPKSQGGKLWLPNVLSQTESLQLGQYVHKGNNIVQFIELSGLSEHIFVLLATAGGKKESRDDFSELKFLFPEESTGMNFQASTLIVDRK